ncbi:MAG: hypothetical protein SGILL_004567, partial [Bacillariaceae sp.]
DCPELDSLPENLGNLTGLKGLNTLWTPLPRLPESIGRLHRLRELHADFSGIGTLPRSFSSLKKLRTVVTTPDSISKFPPSCAAKTLELRWRFQENAPMDERSIYLFQESKSWGRLQHLEVLSQGDCTVHFSNDLSEL